MDPGGFIIKPPNVEIIRKDPRDTISKYWSAKNSRCWQCQDDEETSLHIVCECDAIYQKENYVRKGHNDYKNFSKLIKEICLHFSNSSISILTNKMYYNRS